MSKNKSKGNSSLAGMFNLEMPDDNEDDLMAELAALQGIKPPTKSKRKPEKTMALDQILAESNALINDESLDDSGDEIDDNDLLAELGDILDDDGDDTEMLIMLDNSVNNIQPATNTGKNFDQQQLPQIAISQSPLSVATERRNIFNGMLEKAKAEGNSSKIRRYQRITQQYESALKNLKAGKQFDLSELPEPPAGLKTTPHQQDVSTSEKNAHISSPQIEKPGMNVEEELCQTEPVQEDETPRVNVVNLLQNMDSSISQPEHKVENHVVTILKERGTRYREVALGLHKQGRTDEAKEFLAVSKQFEAALNGYMLGDNVDLSLVPPDPTEYMAFQEKSNDIVTPPKPENASSPRTGQRKHPAGVLVDDEQGTLVALNFRLESFKNQQEKAKAEGNASKARRVGRVIGQCEDIIKKVKLKQPVDFTVLPELPGAEPIPLPPYMSLKHDSKPIQPTSCVESKHTEQTSAQHDVDHGSSSQQQVTPALSGDTLSELEKRISFMKNAAEKARTEGNSSKARRLTRLINQHLDIIKDVRIGKSIDVSDIPDLPGFGPVPLPDYMEEKQQNQEIPVPAPPTKSLKDQLKESTADKNLHVLVTRQGEYKNEALKLYKEGNQVEAKKYLAQAKGFDQMIEACKMGLPVEMTKIPPCLNAPQGKRAISRQNTLPHMSGDIIDMGPSSEDTEEVFNQLVADIENQIDLCKNNAQIFQKLGDLQSAKHYAQQYQNQNKDLTNLKGIYKQKKGIPPYRYEGCRFPILKCCPEISDREAEIVIIRCLNIPVPQGWKPEDLKVHVVWEFTIQDKTAKGQTKSYRGGINPEIFEQFRVDIGDRTARSFARAIKRGNLKVTACYDRGFLKKPGELGSGIVKLSDWENLAELHEVATLLDGRKQTATKVEVKCRIREPVGGAQCEFTDMKWLIVGKSGQAPLNPQPSLSVPKKGRTGNSPNVRRR